MGTCDRSLLSFWQVGGGSKIFSFYASETKANCLHFAFLSFCLFLNQAAAEGEVKEEVGWLFFVLLSLHMFRPCSLALGAFYACSYGGAFAQKLGHWERFPPIFPGSKQR